MYWLEAVSESGWFDSGCGGPRARWVGEGRIEIEGEGLPSKKLPDAVNQWRSEVVSAAAKYGLWPNFVAGVIATESGGSQHAHSSVAYGLMGLVPSTASLMAGRSVGADELLENAALNVELGSKLLDQLFVKYKNNPIKVAASYNAGSPKCGAGKCVQPNRFNLVADCDSKGVAVDYVTRVISYSNAAAAGALKSTPGRSLLVGVGIVLAVGTAIYFARST